MNSTLRGVEDKEQETKIQIDQNIKLMDGLNLALDAASSGALSQSDYEELLSELRSNIKPNGFSPTQVNGFKSNLDKARASSFITEFAAVNPRMNSYALNQLQQYVALKGQGAAENFPAGVKQFGDYILNAVSNPDDLKSVGNEINSLEATYAAREEDERKARERAREIGKVGSGQGNMLNTKDRKAVDELLEREGIDLSQFSQMTPEKQQTALSINRFTAGQESLIDPLAQLAAGIPVSGAESYMQMYAQLSNDMTPSTGTDVVIDRFGTGSGAPLSEVQKQRLNDMLSIYAVQGGDFNTIAVEMAEKKRDGKAAREAFFTKNKEYSNVREYLSTLKSISGNSTVINEMAPVAEYLIGNGLEIDEVQSRIDQIIDKNYGDSEHIIDPMSPSPNLNKSRFALTKTIPDAEARQAFVTKVNAAVASISINGKKLFLGDTRVSETGFRSRVSNDDRVFLRPDPTGASDRYFLYYMDNNELKPLIYSADAQGNQVAEGGQNFWASFSIENEVGDLIRKNQAAEIMKDMSDADRMDFIRKMQIDLKDVPVQDRIEFIRRERLRFESQQEGSM